MEKKTIRRIKWVMLIFSFIALLTFFIIFYAAFTSSSIRLYTENEYNSADNSLYHIIITGTYENRSFLTDLYKGASNLAKDYNTIVDLHVPDSQADTSSLQELMDYCSFLNADGIIAYIDSPDETPSLLHRANESPIPLITTGQFSANIQQISYVGINNWELGKKIADETQDLVSPGGNIYIISDSASTNSANLISSLQLALLENGNLNSQVIEKLSSSIQLSSRENIFICLTEDETIISAQLLSELFSRDNYTLLGFGSNEVCQLYLQKGLITELFSLDPQAIGEAAMRELFEYRSRGHANSYVTAEVKITKAEQ